MCSVWRILLRNTFSSGRQQAWPSGTQQILLPPAWQQLTGVATHTSVQHATVIPESMAGTQPLADWR